MGQTGIRVRHSRRCRSNAVGACNCAKTYEASVYSARDGKRIRKAFPTLAAAKGWRADATSLLSRGGLRAPSALTVRHAAVAFLDGARNGSIRNRSGDKFKPSVVASYKLALEHRILPAFGPVRLSELTAGDVQRLVDRLLAENLDPSTIRNTLMPLRSIYRRACRPGGEVVVNPTRGVEIPASQGRRDRIASPAEAERLIGLLAKRDRALWATAFYAGLRRGELLALRWEDVDLAAGVLRVERAYDPQARVFVEPKSRAGKRKVPIAGVLRDYLLDHKLDTGRDVGLVFGRTAELPFEHSSTRNRARRAWARAEKERKARGSKGQPIAPVGLHEARHTFASLLIDAGVNVKALATFMGHSSVAITLDRYGHLMPGGEEEAAARLDAYLERANTQARLAQVDERASTARQSDPPSSGFERTTADTEDVG